MTAPGDNLQDFDPQIERTVEESLPGFNDAFAKTRALVADFEANQAQYRSPSYQEQEVRIDFINKLFAALGWDVNHEKHKNPFEQEVKVERRVNLARAKKRADYAFYAAPNFRDVLFYVEAKKPYVELATADNYFQTIRYGWNSRTPVAILTSFEEFHILDCRLKPNIDTALQRCLGRFHYTEFADPDKFAFIYYLFSREAVANNSIKKFAAELDTRKRTGKQAKQETGIYQDIDESFLDELDDIRQRLARLFKNGNPKLGGETLTEVTQRVVDRLVFIRFLEDKLIEATDVVSTLGGSSSPWEAFIKASRRLDGIYNGVVFKKHAVLDDADFHADEDEFLAICAELSHANSPYNFDAIPIDILGNIYERFLGKVIVATPKRAIVREKPEVRKSGGVYYTPSYIVNYIVDNTVGRIIAGKTPVQIAKMRFADIACGSGSFLLGMYDCLLRYHTKYYNENPTKAPREDCERREEGLHLTLRKKGGFFSTTSMV